MKKKKKNKNKHCHHIVIEVPFISDKEMDKIYSQIADVLYAYKYPKGIDPYMYGKKSTSCITLDIV